MPAPQPSVAPAAAPALAEVERQAAALDAALADNPDQAAIMALEMQALRHQIEALRSGVAGAVAAPEAEIVSETWRRVTLARHPQRPTFFDWTQALCTDFVELHGDRRFGDDPAIAGGFARFRGREIMILGQERGRGIKEKVRRRFGYPQPEGYRKALRLMLLAQKFERPIVCLIDTSGAYPGADAEERGQAEAIAVNLREMARLRVAVVCVVTGEGGSGGALGIGVGNRVLMMENAWYSVISPEGCAAIRWEDANRKVEAAIALKPTAAEMLALGLIDEVIEEPNGGAHEDASRAATSLGDAVSRHLDELALMPAAELREQRYRRFRAMGGCYTE